ncbi:hypothetical protein [Pedosphaera parvula]|uniref:Uncharacterized protein n=1 Tax=Pedosphaera parvula (strain Ellin514) TaxID=320771 RepID=B9XN86_PEDPL|nr:hypothetical protein [Pedosphaera parvula]EEF58748.1 hypothetical protein Cflav_PD1844 [Pedosphaera parvula Ellin514]
MRPEIRLKFESILSYPFFQAVGKPLPPSITSVKSWPVAVKEGNSRKWENCRLAARNALQEAVQRKSWERLQDWNPLADELRPLILSFVDTMLTTAPVPESYREKLRHELTWDIMFICLEEEYKDLVEPLLHIPQLDGWYAAGHFPCGWDEAEFPDHWDGIIRSGRVMVF